MSYIVTITRVEDNSDPALLLEVDFKEEGAGESIKALGELLAMSPTIEKGIERLGYFALKECPEKVEGLE